MNEKETHYLIKYRDLVRKKKNIETMIAATESICASLKDWQKTTANLGTPASHVTNNAWSEDQLGRLANLKTELITFHQAMHDLDVSWSQLKGDEIIGLKNPTTLRSESA